MNRIDLRTVILLAGVMSGFMAVILYSLKRSYPPTIKGLGEWAAALSLVSAGGVLAFGFGVWPDWVSITLPRLLLPAGLLLSYVGTQRFFGAKPRFKSWVALLGGVVVLQLWFTFIEPSFRIRLGLSTAMGAFLFAAHSNFMRKQGLETFSKQLTMGVLVIMSAIQFMRLLAEIFWPVGTGILDKAPQHMVYILSFSFCIALLSVSLVLLASDRLHEEVSYLASHDWLTNALTRRHMNEVCAIELDRSQRHGRSLALLVMDLDHFKTINDTYGHQGGDEVLIDFVKKVQSLLRRPDQLGRFGGEEFVALLPETALEDAMSVAERIREACASASSAPRCTVSIGVTTNHTTGDTMDTLIARADAAMYAAKAKGRNRVESA